MNRLIASLTFDDGWKTQLTKAVPILDTHGYKGTFYIETQWLYTPNGDRMQPWDVEFLARDGHEIGSHSVTHPYLQWQFWAWPEIAWSKQVLEEIVGRGNVQSFAYPFGRQHTIVRYLVRRAGYTTARILKGKNRGYTWKGTDPFRIECHSVKRDTTTEDIDEWIRVATIEGYWLVFNFHQIQSGPYAWGCISEMLRYVCEKLHECGAIVEPFSAAAERVLEQQNI
jgi:peptidoglycan/xylan/chitin deacetylase (PgdA/CDA1 family)